MSESRRGGTPFPTQNHQFNDPQEIPQFIRQSHEAVKSRWLKIDEAMKMTQAVRGELDKLLGLGTMVDSDDVIKAAATLVGKGVGAHEMASLLADMPQIDGEPIHLWLRANDMKLAQQEQALQPMHSLARHELGLSALRVLTAGHLEGMGDGGQIDAQRLPQGGMNALAATPPQGNA